MKRRRWALQASRIAPVVLNAGADLPEQVGTPCCEAWTTWGFSGWGRSFRTGVPAVPSLEGLERGRTRRGWVWSGVGAPGAPEPGRFGTRTSGSGGAVCWVDGRAYPPWTEE